MLVVEFIHEFELGVWKAVFIYFLRILDYDSEVSNTNWMDGMHI
jgi:hypothetical protein